MRSAFFFPLLFLPFLVWAQSPVLIDDDFGYQVLGEELQVIHDPSAMKTFEEIRHMPMDPVSEPRPNFGYVDGAIWVKTEIKNERSIPLVKFQINQPQLDTVDFYVFDGNEIVAHYQMGQAFPFEDRIYDKPNFLIDLQIPQGETRWVFTRISSFESVILPVYVATPEGLNDMEHLVLLLFGAYFGLIIAMAVYNLFLSITTRDGSYLYYVIYILAVGSTQAVLEGFLDKYLWPNNPWFAMRSVYFFTSFVSISSLIFMRHFLRTKIYAPFYHNAANLLFGFFGLIFFLSLFSLNTFVHTSAQMGIGLVALYIFLTSITVYRRGYQPAKFFLIAWLVLLIGICVYAMKDAGIIASTPVTNYLLQFGSAVEALLLSMALADRINILKREKSESQEEALKISLENERIVKEHNIILEQRVKARTADLEATNEQLNDALEDLKNAQSQLVNSEKMASLGQLSAGIAHEINNPINFVGANITPLELDIREVLEVLKRYESIESAAEFEEKVREIASMKEDMDFDYTLKEIEDLLKGIKHGAERTAAIVAGLKNFSRMDESEMQLFDLNEGLESTLLILSNEIPDWVKMDIRFGDIPKVECLGGKINQVFLNIINNGLQAFASWPERENRLYEISSWGDEGQVFFRFKDNAGGMSKETMDRIYDPFFTTKNVGHGTGLGMSISYQIIKAHGGTIEIESEEGEGTVFTLNLPVIGTKISEEL